MAEAGLRRDGYAQRSVVAHGDRMVAEAPDKFRDEASKYLHPAIAHIARRV
jgi:hypothetical protein